MSRGSNLGVIPKSEGRPPTTAAERAGERSSTKSHHVIVELTPSTSPQNATTSRWRRCLSLLTCLALLASVVGIGIWAALSA